MPPNLGLRPKKIFGYSLNFKLLEKDRILHLSIFEHLIPTQHLNMQLDTPNLNCLVQV